MKQIAQLAGVSRGTVDRVLNNRGIVNEKTAQKIREIAESMQYKPSKAARSLAALKRNIHLAYILFDPAANDFFKQVELGIQKKSRELSEYGVSVEVLYSNFADPNSQRKLLNNVVEQGVDGIVIAGFNTAEDATQIREIVNKGIPVITVNSDIKNSGRIAFVGSNYYKSGETAGGLMRLMTKGSATVGIVLGSRNVLCHAERVEGFTNHLKKYAPNIEIACICENHDDDFESFSATQKMLEQHPNIDALFLAAGGVFGACRAVESRNPKRSAPLVICYDNPPTTCTMLEKGIIAAAICQQPERQGSKPLDLLFNQIAMGVAPDKENYFTEIEIVIRESLQLNELY